MVVRGGGLVIRPILGVGMARFQAKVRKVRKDILLGWEELLVDGDFTEVDELAWLVRAAIVIFVVLVVLVPVMMLQVNDRGEKLFWALVSIAASQ